LRVTVVCRSTVEIFSVSEPALALPQDAEVIDGNDVSTGSGCLQPAFRFGGLTSIGQEIT
jgi:hypothetical protein